MAKFRKSHVKTEIETEGRPTRKSKYEQNVRPYLEKIESWISKGATQEEIAKKLHIAESTLALYLKKGREGQEPYSELSALFVRACEEPDDQVEASLYRSACGYTVDLQKTFKVRKVVYDPETGRKVKEYDELVTGVDQVHVPANVEAQKFWLANRRRDKWSYKPEAVDDGNDENTARGVIMIPEVVQGE